MISDFGHVACLKSEITHPKSSVVLKGILVYEIIELVVKNMQTKTIAIVKMLVLRNEKCFFI